MAVVLADVLDSQSVILDLRARTFVGALEEIIGTMTGDGKVPDAEKFLGEVLVREQQTSTFVGNGVAFPHARTDLVSEIVLGIGRSREGVPSADGSEQVNLLFVVAVPRRLIKDYLGCIGALARLVKDRRTREALMNTGSTTEFVELLRAGSLELE
jgi:mannitol/fructose-specific phosphotransferase system IIA component (Ntr-type)